MRRSSPLIMLAAVLAWLGAAPPTQAQDASDRCGGIYEEADGHYLNGRFPDAITLLQTCVDEHRLEGKEAARVYRLLALAYLYNDEEPRARASLRALLALVPDYESDLVQDPPSYASLVGAVREESAGEAPPVSTEPTAAQEVPNEPVGDDAEEQAVPADGDRQVEESAPPTPSQEPPPPLLPPPGQAAGDDDTLPAFRLAGPKQWFMAAGGAAVVFAAVALALGG